MRASILQKLGKELASSVRLLIPPAIEARPDVVSKSRRRAIHTLLGRIASKAF
jgi:hypothetical protein